MTKAASASSSQPRSLKESLMLIGVGYLILLLCDPKDGIAKLSIQYLLKDHLHLSAAQIATYLAIVNFAWYCKPVAGLLADGIPIFGSRRRSYLLLSAGMASVLWLMIWFAPKSYESLLWLHLVLNIMLVLGQTTLGGLLVESGKALSATGRMSSQRIAAENVGILLSGLIGGWMAAHALGIPLTTNVVLLASLAAIIFLHLREPKVEHGDRSVWSTAGKQVKGMFASKTMWIACGLWFLVRFSPGFQTPLFFYQTETLKFKPEFIGFLGFFNGGCAVIAAAIYMAICRKLPLRLSLLLGVGVNLCCVLLYFLYRSEGTSMLVEGAAGFGTAAVFIPNLDLLARATPKGAEALGYA